jgi:hypothetical protein
MIRATARVRDEYGDPITPSHVLPLPETSRDPDDRRTLAQVVADWQAQVEAEREARRG